MGCHGLRNPRLPTRVFLKFTPPKKRSDWGEGALDRVVTYAQAFSGNPSPQPSLFAQKQSSWAESGSWMLPLVAMQSRSDAASADENAQQHPQLDWSRMSLITLAHFGLEREREKERRRMVERTSASLSKAPEHKYPRWSGAPAPRMWGMYTLLETCQFTAESKASGTGGPVLV